MWSTYPYKVSVTSIKFKFKLENRAYQKNVVVFGSQLNVFFTDLINKSSSLPTNYIILLIVNVYLLSLGDYGLQIISLTVQIQIPTNLDDSYDPNLIPTTILSRWSRCQFKFDLLLIKNDHFWSNFDLLIKVRSKLLIKRLKKSIWIKKLIYFDFFNCYQSLLI